MRNPEPGTIISVNKESFTFLKTDEPAIRIVYDNEWVAIDPAKKRGLIVFIRHPKEVIDRITKLKIVSVSNKVAFAIAL